MSTKCVKRAGKKIGLSTDHNVQSVAKRIKLEEHGRGWGERSDTSDTSDTSEPEVAKEQPCYGS